MSSAMRGQNVRPSLDRIDTSAGGSSAPSEGAYEEEETVESVMNKLSIERKVQYGAEKMLDVIEQRTGSEASETKQRITAQLEAAANRIKELEAQLDRLQLITPARSKRRPQARLNGFASSSSLSVGQTMSSSVSSSGLLAATRPHMSRQGSRLTPDREHLDVLPNMIPLPTTPSRAAHSTVPGSGHSQPHSYSHSRRRSLSTGAESLSSPQVGDGFGTTRMGWGPSASSPGDIAEEHYSAGMIETAVDIIKRLRQLGTRRSAKGKEVDRGDEACQCMSKLAGLCKKTPSLRLLLSVDEIIEVSLLFLGDSSTARRRSAAYRLLRQVLDRQAWGKMLEAGMEWLIIRTFTRDAKHVHEREQALRLLRSVITLPAPPPASRPSSSRASRKHGSRSRRPSHSRHPSTHDAGNVFVLILAQKIALTDGILRSLVSVAENPDDALRTICMQTLIEIGLVDIDRLVQTDAFRIVLLVLKDGPSELGPSVAALLAFLANMPHTRHRLVPGSDIESTLVGFTEHRGKPTPRQQASELDRIQANVRNVTILLNTWSGFLYLCMDKRRAITALISSLLVPHDETRDALLMLLFTIFKIKPPAWKDAFLEGKRLTVYNRAQEAVSSALQENNGETETLEAVNLIDQYVALLMATFIECGLLDALVPLIGENVSALNRKATLLLGEILQKASRILPLQYAAQVQALPRLFAESMDFSDPISRSSALSALSSIGSLARNHQGGHGLLSRSASEGRSDSLLRGQKQVQQAKLRSGLSLDDRQFIQMINDTGVILNSDHTKWNYDFVVELLEGPLMNARRLDEAIKATKLVRRLFAFFHPYNGRFSAIKRTRPNQKWVKLGCTLMTTMLVNPEGVRYLAEDRLLPQLVDCLSNIDERTPRTSSSPVFTKDRIDKTLTHGYFDILGVLTKYREGMQLLEKCRVFSPIYHLTEQSGRETVVRFVIECFDYTIDGHPRIILSKALTTANLTTRLFATHHLGRILNDHPTLDDWAIQLMTTQLYDTAIEICDIALMYLEEACKDPVKLEKVVAMRPALEHLGDIGHPLFMRFVATSTGFEYLKDADYIDRELEIWLSEKNLLYVIEVETWVSQTLRPFSSDTVEDYWSYDSTAPSHFLGELTKTEEGCQFLREKGIVSGLADIVRLHGLEPSNDAVLTSLKCALWALGNIGSTDGGLPFLEDEEIIEAIIEIAEQSPVLSMRGTGFFVIGLISAGRQGSELLEELGWISTRTALGASTGLCLPTDIDRFASVQPWTRVDNPVGNLPLPKLTGLEGEIMTFVANLSNHVLAASAMNNLKRIRNRHSRYFASITLFHRALRMISTNHYPAPVRRFILELFDIKINAETLVQLRHIELQSFTQPVPMAMANLHEHADEALSHKSDHSQDDHDGSDHRRRSASYPGPERPATSRKRGLTISEIPNTPGTDGPGQGHDVASPVPSGLRGGGGGAAGAGETEGVVGGGGGGGGSVGGGGAGGAGGYGVGRGRDRDRDREDLGRHLPREKVHGFGENERRTSAASSSRGSSAPMSRQSSRSGQHLFRSSLDPSVETLA